MKSDDIKGALMLAAAGAAAYVAWKSYSKAGEAVASMVDTVSTAAETVGGWVNPTADTNLAYRGVNALGSWATGDANYSLGGATYDGVQSSKAELSTWSKNPASPDNPYYKTVSAAGQKITGKKDWSLGTAAYDFFNPEPAIYNSTAINSAALQDAKRVEAASAAPTYFEQFGISP